MIRLKDLSDEQAKRAIEQGEFPEDVRGSCENVVVVLTQGWCPDWHALNASINTMQSKGRPENMDIDVYVFVYNKSDLFDEFRSFKEEGFGNHEIPYLRFYKNGNFVTDDNYVTAKEFAEKLGA
jgi:hypothetical protein